MNYRVVQSDGMVDGIQSLRSDGDSRQHLEQVFLGIDARLFELTSSLERESPATAEALDLLNKSLAFSNAWCSSAIMRRTPGQVTWRSVM